MAPTTSAATQWENVRQAAKRTGFAECTIREMIAEGRLPAYRLSNKPAARIRLKTTDVDALLQPYIPPQVYGTGPSGA